MPRSALFLLLAVSLVASPVVAGTLRVAVASNFAATLQDLAQAFEKQTGHRVLVAPGSTGKHYAQIRHGAPFDLFFAADSRRPKLLETAGLAVAGSRFTYARGRVVLWSPRPGYVDTAGEVLTSDTYRHLAIANPKLAPYGVAAREVLERRGLWAALQSRLVRGENIAQTYQFVKSGNAELGFVARSQIQRPGKGPAGSWWLVPETAYTPIDQQVIQLSEKAVAGDFLRYVQSDAARAIIRGYGYATP
jgi:molybdate transport system substrate-binding protein